MADISGENKNFFQTSAFLSLTIGIPFCIFKFIFGLISIKNHIAILGWIVLIWACVDLLMNLLRIACCLMKKMPPVEFCLIAHIGRFFRKASMFLAVDTFLSFCIICWFLWSGWIKELNDVESYFWYAATTVNLVSLSIVSIWNEFKSSRTQE